MPEKKKRPPTKFWLFLLLWVIGYMASWGLTIGTNQVLYQHLPYDFTSSITASFSFWRTGQFVLSGGLGAIPFIPIILWQKYLLKSRLHHSMLYWRRSSYTALFVGAGCLQLLARSFAHSNLTYTQQTNQMPLALQALILVMCPALVQWYLLRKTFQYAWIWLLANLVGGLLFAIPLRDYDLYTLYNQAGAFAVAAVLQSVVTGITLFWILRPEMAYPALHQDKTGTSTDLS
jgi:hypothetical protein